MTDNKEVVGSMEWRTYWDQSCSSGMKRPVSAMSESEVFRSSHKVQSANTGMMTVRILVSFPVRCS